jgi:predicted aspartyl protease
MPALQVKLHSSASDLTSEVLIALIDTGADATIVPMHYLLEINAEEIAPGWLRGVTGERIPVRLYFADIQFQQILCPGVRVIGSTTETTILLGRDVLNRLSLFLDGPQQQTDLLDDAATQRLSAQHQTTS